MGHIETVEAGDLENVLARVLGTGGGAARASRAHVKAFMKYISVCKLGWTAFRNRRGPQDTALLFVLFLPGKTAIAMLPDLEAGAVRPEDQDRLLTAGLAQLAARDLYYVQALVEPEADVQHAVVRRNGFRAVTQLVYLQRDVTAPPWEPPRAEEVTWVAYEDQHHDAFARVMVQTYEDSRDCPELTGLRPIDAVIASHQAAGEFNPALWEIACVAGEHAGCVLLSSLTDRASAEIVYMGVVRRWRRHGVGGLLLRRALQHCRAVGVTTLTAVADERNMPARNLYGRFAFRPTAVRAAYIYTW